MSEEEKSIEEKMQSICPSDLCSTSEDFDLVKEVNQGETRVPTATTKARSKMAAMKGEMPFINLFYTS
jgi:hypothetical protein